MKPERRSVKQGMALTPTEWKAILWMGKLYQYRGLAVLRLWSLDAIVALWKYRAKGSRRTKTARGTWTPLKVSR